MARNSHNGDRRRSAETTDQFNIGRRSWLGVMGSALVGGAAASGTAGASDGNWHEIQITEPDEVDYVFTCTGEIRKVQDGSDSEAEDNDEVWDNGDGTWTCDGYTGNGYGDTFEFKGDCVEFGPRDGDFTIELDGEVVSTDELVEHNTIPIGGGAGYYRKVPQSEATTTVSTYSELEDALANASAGDVVYVDPAADIDTGTNELSVPGDIVLASDRGIDGSPGGRLYTDDSPWAMLEVNGSGTRITGLRIEGRLETTGWASNDDNADIGVDVFASNVEVDNCELYGFTYGACRTNSDTHFHHNECHHNSMDGWGYGIVTRDDYSLIEWNHFYFNRHSIAAVGDAGNGYTARFNHVTGDEAWAHNFDMHQPGGETMQIHHNTIEPVISDEDGDQVPGVTIREDPSDIAEMWNNWFYNPDPPEDDPEPDDTYKAIVQIGDTENWDHVESWQNVEFWDNAYGSSEPAAEIGHPRRNTVPTPVIDDFERSSPLNEYGGADNLYSVETSTVYHREQALTNASGSYGTAVSTSGLDRYPERGDEETVYFNNAADDNFMGFEFFTQAEEDEPDGYTAGISGQGAWRLWVRENGSLSQIASQDLSTSDQIDGWYRVEVRTDSTTVYADLYDDANDTLLASISADDTTFSSGGIGFRSAGNGEVWDYASLEPVEDFERSSPISEYGGSTGAFSVETSTVFKGSQALTNASGNYNGIASTSGLGNYPDRGDTVVYYLNNAQDDNYAAVQMFAQSEADNPNSYSAGISGQGAWKLWLVDDSGVNLIAEQDLPADDQIDGWYRVEMWSDSTTVYADLYNDATGKQLASVQADDTTWSSGGIGFRSAGNGEVWDYVYR